MIHFILGGARSGKSSFAERQALSYRQSTQKLANSSMIYVATATNTDDEMKARIQQHQQERDACWQLIECPLMLPELVNNSDCQSLYLIDCLTLWLNNLLFALTAENHQKKNELLSQYIDELISALSASTTTFFIVSNEVGLGVIPMGSDTRLFVDHCGWLNQKVAAIADIVTLVTAGIPMTLKSTVAKSFNNSAEQPND